MMSDILLTFYSVLLLPLQATLYCLDIALTSSSYLYSSFLLKAFLEWNLVNAWLEDSWNR